MGGEISGAGLWVGPDRLPSVWLVPGDTRVRRPTTTPSGASPSPTIVSSSRRSASRDFQAGLSWLTILRKRDNFRRAFAGFDIERVARFGARDVTRLLQDEGIVRHRGKIESVINNAKRCRDLIDEHQSLANYIWTFEPDQRSRPKKITWEGLRTMSLTPESTALSRDLRKRGWSFVGPTTMYAFMQAMGLVNDHLRGLRHPLTRDRAGAALTRRNVLENAGQSHRATIRPSRGVDPTSRRDLLTMPRHRRQVSTASRRADGRASS